MYVNAQAVARTQPTDPEIVLSTNLAALMQLVEVKVLPAGAGAADRVAFSAELLELKQVYIDHRRSSPADDYLWYTTRIQALDQVIPLL